MSQIEMHDIADIKIDISINKGIYLFNNASGTGKTYLSQLLGELCRRNKKTYKLFNNLNKNDTEQSIIDNSSNNDIVFYDNADLYLNDNILNNIRNISCVLISMKNYHNLHVDYKKCEITYDNDKISLRE